MPCLLLLLLLVLLPALHQLLPKALQHLGQQ
jgi:hypothetical protein